MKPIPLKVARIGNSRGVRLPAATLERYHIGTELMMEERSDGILLRPVGLATPKLSWAETARAMAAAPNEWSVWDAVVADGLDDLPWDAAPRSRVADATPEYRAPRPQRRA